MTTQISGTSGIVTSTLDLTTPLPESEGGTGSTSAYKMGYATPKSATGTSVDFTGIPSWAKRITILFDGVSLSGSSPPIVQLGDAGGIEDSGYLGAASFISSAVGTANYTTGLALISGAGGANILHGGVIISNLNSNTWVSQAVFGRSESSATHLGASSKTLSATLDRLRITAVNGTDTFDAGTINVMWEGF